MFQVMNPFRVLKYFVLLCLQVLAWGHWVELLPYILSMDPVGSSDFFPPLRSMVVGGLATLNCA